MAGLFEFLGGVGKGVGGAAQTIGSGMIDVGREMRGMPTLEQEKKLEEQQRQQQELKNDLERIKAAGGINTPVGRQMLSELSTKYSPEMFMKTAAPQTPLQKQQTRAAGALADIRERDLTEEEKPDIFKFADEFQDIDERVRKGDLTEAAGRAWKSRLASESQGAFGGLAGMFEFPEREKEPEYLTEEQKQKAAEIKAGLEPKAQPPETPTQKIEYWQNGQKHSELVKPSEYTARVKEIQTAGGTLETPKTRQEQKKIQLELDTMETKLKQLKDKPMAQYVRYYLDLARNAIAIFDNEAAKQYNQIAARLIKTMGVPKIVVINPQGNEVIMDSEEWSNATEEQKKGWKEK